MKPRILVVQEDAAIADRLWRKLTSVGFDVALAAGGFQGLKKHAAFDPDLVLLDLKLRTPGGLEVCKKLNARQPRAGIIVLTEKHRKREGLEELITGWRRRLSNEASCIRRTLHSYQRRTAPRSKGDTRAPAWFVARRFHAVRARSISNDAQRRSLLEQGYANAVSAVDVKDRSLAVMFIERTWACDLVSSDTAANALDGLLQKITPKASEVQGGRPADADLFGPRILELMTVLNPNRAAVIATKHPDWEATRKIPGRTPGNPLGGPVMARPLHPGCPPQTAIGSSEAANPTGRPKSPGPPIGMTLEQIDQALRDARGLSPQRAKIQKLISLGELVLTAPVQ